MEDQFICLMNKIIFSCSQQDIEESGEDPLREIEYNKRLNGIQINVKFTDKVQKVSLIMRVKGKILKISI